MAAVLKGAVLPYACLGCHSLTVGLGTSREISRPAIFAWMMHICLMRPFLRTHGVPSTCGV